MPRQGQRQARVGTGHAVASFRRDADRGDEHYERNEGRMLDGKEGAYSRMNAFMTCFLLAAAAVRVPLASVVEVPDSALRRYPARVCAIAEVDIRPQVNGEILEIGFANGGMVKKGDMLYRIDSLQYEAAVWSAEAQVAKLKSSLEYAELVVKRHEKLVQTRAVSQDDYDRSRSECLAARAALKAAEAALTAAKHDLDHCVVKAPISGRIGSTQRTEGNFVQRGGDPLVKLVQSDPIRVRFSISSVDYDGLFASEDARIVEEGRVVFRHFSSADVCATGRVEYVENVAEGVTDSVSVYAIVANPRGTLRPGQTLMAFLTRENGQMVTAVPPHAVIEDVRGSFLWVVDGSGRACRRDVSRGSIQDGLQIVTRGLKVGERIVADGGHKVSEGVVVEVAPEGE